MPTLSTTVCLITPPSIFLLDERVFMTLGILKIAGVLEQAGTAVEMLDLSGVENYLEAVRIHAAASPAQVFGLTATTPQMLAVGKIQEVLRATRPDARLIRRPSRDVGPRGGEKRTRAAAAGAGDQGVGAVGRSV
jgi:hypothetical protein